MNKGAIKSYAVFARKLLKEKIDERLNELGIVINTNNHGEEVVFCEDEKFKSKEIQALIKVLRKNGYNNLVEEAAYEWFIEIILIRFFEVNKYLPENIGILSSSSTNHKYPDILYYKNCEMSLDNECRTNIEKIYRQLVIEQCRELSMIFPKCFKSMKEYVELLLPSDLLNEDSIIQRLVCTVSEEDFKEVEILGWFYQFYMSEAHHYIVGMNNGIIKKEHIPIATQLFTPKWIVMYMVDNSLGKLLVEDYQLESLKDNLSFYIEDSNKKTKKEIPPKLEDIKILDPACGTGNILIYCFELLFKAYLSQGYLPEEIPLLILRNNIYGLDIDSKTVDLAIFSLIVKAREVDNKFFYRVNQTDYKMNLISLEESNDFIEYLETELNNCNCCDNEKKKILNICDGFVDAKEYGSLLEVPSYSDDFYEAVISKIMGSELKSKNLLLNIIMQSKVMGAKYDIVVANPPYMSKKYMTINLKSFINKFYYDYNGDLFSVFILRNLKYTKEKGYAAFMTPFVWMFIKEYEKLREHIINHKTIVSLVQLEYSAYKDAAVPICTFVLKNYKEMLSGIYIKLSDFRGKESQAVKVIEAVKDKNIFYRYLCNSDFFKYIPGKPIAYWLPEELLETFTKEKRLESFIDITGSQNITADNDKYLRKHWEVNIQDIDKKWCFYTKGGEYRKWYGNVDYVVDWSIEAREFYRRNKTSNLLNKNYWFREGLTYNGISIKGFAVRKVGKNIYDKGGPTFHIINKSLEKYILALLNSKIIEYIMNLYNPTINYQIQDIKNLPIIITEDEFVFKRIIELCDECVAISKDDWDSVETSWEFETHPIIKYGRGLRRIEDAYENWKKQRAKSFEQFKKNEEEINRLFIKIYHMEEILLPQVDEKNITIQKPNLSKDLKSFISYGVGCIMGRYSVDEKGIAYAGGIFNVEKYKTIKPAQGGLCALSKYNLGENDLVNRFIDFIEVLFGKEYIDDNLQFISKALNSDNSKEPEKIIREYFNYDFFKDHYRNYKKRPIYFMLYSGRRRTLGGLLYIHRMDNNSIEILKREYGEGLHLALKHRLIDIQKFGCKKDISLEYLKEIRKKEIYCLKQDLLELDKYFQSIEEFYKNNIKINLDDGIRNNYLKFSKLLLSCK